MAEKKGKNEDVREEAAEVYLGEKPAEDASDAVREELAKPRDVEGTREQIAERKAPFPGDGTNTGTVYHDTEGTRPGVTVPETESHPEVGGDADALIRDKRNAEDDGDAGDEQPRARRAKK